MLEKLGVLGVLVILAGWLGFVWVVAHQPTVPPERAIWNDQQHRWERPPLYRIEGP